MERALSFPRDCSGRKVCVAPEFRPGHHCLLPSPWAEREGKRVLRIPSWPAESRALEISSGVSWQPSENTDSSESSICSCLDVAAIEDMWKTHLKMLGVSHI